MELIFLNILFKLLNWKFFPKLEFLKLFREWIGKVWNERIWKRNLIGGIRCNLRESHASSCLNNVGSVLLVRFPVFEVPIPVPGGRLASCPWVSLSTGCPYAVWPRVLTPTSTHDWYQVYTCRVVVDIYDT